MWQVDVVHIYFFILKIFYWMRNVLEWPIIVLTQTVLFLLQFAWNEELCPHELSSIGIQDVFIVCCKITFHSSLQWLQYIILHRIFPVCYYLKTIKIRTDDCCGTETETIPHEFVMCENKILQLWRTFNLHIYTTTSKSVGFNVVHIIFNENNKVTNCIILCCKQYIFLLVSK